MNLEFAATAQEEAEKINAQTGIGLVTDQAFWEKQGVVTGEDLAFSILSQTYSDAYKSLHGIRPRWAEFKTVQEIEDALDELDQQAEAMAEDEAVWAQIDQEGWEKERQELEDLSRPGLDLEYEKVPQRSGMGRRMEGRASVKLTKKQLRKIIRESLVADHDIINALQDTWEQVRMDVGIPNATSEEKSDEALAMMQTYHPEAAAALHSKTNAEIDELVWAAFGK